MWKVQTQYCWRPQGMCKDKRTRPGLPWKCALESSDDDSTWVTEANVAETKIMQYLTVSRSYRSGYNVPFRHVTLPLLYENESEDWQRQKQSHMTKIRWLAHQLSAVTWRSELPPEAKYTFPKNLPSAQQCWVTEKWINEKSALLWVVY